MNLIHATSFLLACSVASTKSEPSSLSNEEGKQPIKSIAGLRELQKFANSENRVLFGDLLSGFGGLDCSETCDDSSKCTSFMGTPDLTTLQASCDAGCIPEIALSTCDQFCGDDDTATISIQRMNIFDSAVDLMCGNCKFYECCGSDGASYESCEGSLPDMVDLSDLDSLLPGLGDEPGLDSFLPDLGDFPDLDELLPDALAGLDMGNLPDIGSIIPDWDAAFSGSGSGSGISVLGQVGALGGIFDCPQTCGNADLCKSAFMSMGGTDDETLKDACNEGCLPVVSASFCEDACRDVDGSEFIGSVVDVACDACKFVECCVGDRSDGEKFATCKELLPTMDSLMPNIDLDMIDTAEWNYTNWGDSLDWSGISSGLSELVENLHSLFDEALGDFDSFPVTCNSETCPIDGLCDMGTIRLSSVNFEDACKSNTFFECAEGLEEMCANECDGAGIDDNFFSASFCSMCNMAECCRDSGGTTSFEDCVLGVVPQEVTDAVESITDSIADSFEQLSDLDPEGKSKGSADAPVDVSQSGGSPYAPVENYEDIELDVALAAESSDSSSQGLAPEVSSEDPTNTPIEASLSESSEDVATPIEDSASDPLDTSTVAIEVSRYETAVESGSHTLETSIFVTLSTIAVLVLVPFRG